VGEWGSRRRYSKTQGDGLAGEIQKREERESKKEGRGQ
jgi:hypothetical protein